MTTSQMSPGSRGLPSTPGNGSGAMTFSATSFTSDAERYLSGSGILNTSRSRHFLVVNSAIQLHRLRRLGSTELVSVVVEYDERPDQCTIYHPDSNGIERMSNWISADTGCFIDLY